MNEVWKPIAGYEGLYEVSNLGQVRSLDSIRKMARGKGTFLWRGRILKQSSLPAGYKYAMLSKDNKPKHGLVHRFVASAFVDNPNGYGIVNHIDGVKSHNVESNLQWVTSSQNNIHAIYAGLRIPPRGQQVSTAKLTDEMVIVMRRLALKLSIKDIADAFGVSPNCASDIIQYKAWKHVA